MILWDRIERWRSDKDIGIDRSFAAIDPYDAGKLNARLECASELEADLRELSETVEKLVAHKIYFRGPDAKEVHVDCPRCALEARIGGAK